jgi:glycine dehydrogenase subunit 1
MPYVPHTAEDVQRMLQRIEVRSVEDLFRSIPSDLRARAPLAIPEAQTEAAVLREMSRAASRNSRVDDRPCFLGAGVYNRFIPAAVDYLSSRGEFNTAYTPYQPEASQGTLQAIFEYQSMIARLCGLEISNASLYDAATALVEAALMAYTLHQKGTRLLVSAGVHPEYRQVLETYFRHHPIRVETLPLGRRGALDPAALEARLSGGEVFAMAIQSPNFFGVIEDGAALRAALGEGTTRPLLLAAVDPISLALLQPPGSYGADIAVGDGQPLGNEPSYGGPTFGFFATREAHVRKVPGRIVGETRDREGRRGYVLTFQTREQHIRRERATSNICTNQGLVCLRGAMYLAFLGEKGLRAVAERTTRAAHLAARKLAAIPGVRPVFDAPFFGEFALSLPVSAAEAYRSLGERGIIGGLPLGRYFPEREKEMLFSVTEMTSLSDIDRLVEALREILKKAEGGRRKAEV